MANSAQRRPSKAFQDNDCTLRRNLVYKDATAGDLRHQETEGSGCGLRIGDVDIATTSMEVGFQN